MEIIVPRYQILTNIDAEIILPLIERVGRTAYQSYSGTTLDSSKAFISQIIKRGHESVIEHYSITVCFICDRGVTHELVRHRLASYTQESTRYCNYSKLGVQFMDPSDWDLDEEDLALLNKIEEHYNKCLLKKGRTAQQSRYFLPNGLKTEIIMTCNLREWRHMFKLRTAKTAHPDMVALMTPLLFDFKEKIPIIFDDI